MALVASNDERLDQSKCVQMALAHDMAEAVVGDITPHDGVSKVKTHELHSTPSTSHAVSSCPYACTAQCRVYQPAS
jgi:5'-deoxynucleotidase YfbR-like HD superfamily hydrolase